MNKNEAVNRMVRDMTSIPYSVLEKLQKIYYETGDEEYMVEEITPREYVDEYEYGNLPIHGTLWELDSIEQYKIEEGNEELIKGLVECGFRIYETWDYGYVIGIDGTGYDFYDSHWLPLYNLLELKWHNEPYKYNCVTSDKNGNRIKFEPE